MNMRRILLLCALVVVPMLSSAQMYAMRDSVSNGYNFWLYVPEGYEDCRVERAKGSEEVSKPKPVVIFLHGRSLSGTDIYKVRKYGTLDALWRGRKIDAVVIAPQVNHGDWWRPERVMNVVDWVAKRYDVDLTRVYVLGMSLGGYGAIDVAAAYPDRIAAAIGLCGGSTKRTSELGALNKVPLWIMHGTADASVAVSASRRVRDGMKEAGSTSRLRYDEHAGAGHSIYARTFYLPEAYEWLFKHSTTDKNRPVDKSVKIPYSRFSNAYSGLPRGGGKVTIIDPPTKANTKGRYIENVESAANTKASKAAQKSENKESKKESSASSDEVVSSGEYHTVVEGDTLGHIAKKYGTTVDKLCELNDMEKTDILRLGVKIRVSEAQPEPVVEYHTIAEGDTYYSIADKYGTTVEKIFELNNITATTIYHPGDKIIVRSSAPAAKSNKKSGKQSKKSASTPQYHTIEEGDTLGHIAIKYNTTVAKLCELNDIEKSDILKLGKKLRVK